VASAEMQLSQEELKSSNEELQSSNEELQSTNEELTTTKEEVQSLNEELKVVNYELMVRIDDLAQSNNDMNNLMNSTKIATLFLDSLLRVKRFTKQMSLISKLIENDIGRPVTDIASNLFYPELAEDVGEVLRTLNTVEKQVRSDDGSYFNVRILPYRTLEDKIDGVVITFIDVTEAKKLEAELRRMKSVLEKNVLDKSEELAQVRQVYRETAAGKGSPGGDR
jgi:transcriptional regulator with PAS, ATPase and Fis domain